MSYFGHENLAYLALARQIRGNHQKKSFSILLKIFVVTTLTYLWRNLL